MGSDACAATSHETRWSGYIWGETWSSLEDYDRLFSGNIALFYVCILIFLIYVLLLKNHADSVVRTSLLFFLFRELKESLHVLMVTIQQLGCLRLLHLLLKRELVKILQNYSENLIITGILIEVLLNCKKDLTKYSLVYLPRALILMSGPSYFIASGRWKLQLCISVLLLLAQSL